MGDVWVLIIVLIAVAYLLLPILAISAYIRVRRLERRGPDAIDALTKRMNALERSLHHLQQALAGLEARPAAAQPLATAPVETREPSPAQPPAPLPAVGLAPPPAHPGGPAPPAAAAAPVRAAGVDLETLIAGRWLNRIGIVALLVATAFFLKYAFENDWVGPSGRVAIGLLAGTVLLVYSQWLLRRGYLYFSEGIAGLAAGVLYLSLYAGWDYYKLFSQAAAFGGMVVVTAAMVAIAVGRDSQRIALLAVVGGLLTPALVSTGTDQQVILFSYLAVLDAGLLALAHRRDWRAVEFTAFVGSQIYFWAWYAEFYNADKLERTAAFATLFFVLFAALPVLRSRRLVTLPGPQVALILANASLYLLALRAMLWPERRWTLTLAVLALAAGHLVVANKAPAPRPGPSTPLGTGERALVRLLYAGLALTFVTLAIPIRLEGRWITIAWAVQGAVLIWSGFQAALPPLRRAGVVLFAIVAFRLLVIPIAGEQLLWNARFAVFAVTVACFGAALYFARQHADQLDSGETGIFGLVGVGANFFALLVLSLEVWHHFDRQRAAWGNEAELGQQLGLSLLWTLYATALILLGVRTGRATLRWQALALFGLAVAKVFLYDLWLLERVYRIISFVVLGVVLLVVSFLYQRRLAARREEQG